VVDTLSKAERSERMRRIRGKDTAPELALRSALHAEGLRFRLHRRDLPGRPDIVLPKFNTVIFVHGCFWHRHEGCSISTTPKSNTVFWVDKFERNVARDRLNVRGLRRLGWKVITVWECELSSPERARLVAQRLARRIRGRMPTQS
jgi:DNA mismatch endonuclease (patch repair protein)